MSKKQKRRTTSSTSTSTRQTPTRSSYSTPSRSVTSAEFNPDYSYVIKDLKRIGTLAGTFFVILIILSFFLR
jgi:hypothetical protein